MPSRNSLLAEVDSILHQPTLTHEQGARATTLLALANSLTDLSDLERGRDQRRRNVTARREGRPIVSNDGDTEFHAYLRGGQLSPASIRAAQSESGGVSTGGALVPQSFSEKLESMMALYDSLFSVAALWEPETGSPGAYPILTDETSTSTVIAENATVTTDTNDVTFGALSFPVCQTFRTTAILASVELTQDSFFDLDTVLAAALAIRLARGAGANLVTALLSAATSGVTTASPTAIAPDELIACAESLNAAYFPGAAWMMNQSTQLAIAKLKASTNSYLFPEVVDPTEPSLLGFPLLISPSFPNVGAGTTPLAFGDFSRFVRRSPRNGLRVQVLREQYMILGKIGFLGFLRTDGQLLQSATTSPVMLLTMHA